MAKKVPLWQAIVAGELGKRHGNDLARLDAAIADAVTATLWQLLADYRRDDEHLPSPCRCCVDAESRTFADLAVLVVRDAGEVAARWGDLRELVAAADGPPTPEEPVPFHMRRALIDVALEVGRRGPWAPVEVEDSRGGVAAGCGRCSYLLGSARSVGRTMRRVGDAEAGAISNISTVKGRPRGNTVTRTLTDRVLHAAAVVAGRGEGRPWSLAKEKRGDLLEWLGDARPEDWRFVAEEMGEDVAEVGSFERLQLARRADGRGSRWVGSVVVRWADGRPEEHVQAETLERREATPEEPPRSPKKAKTRKSRR